MHDSYSDITSRIKEEPIWYDINGVPRYDQPHVPLHLMGKIRCQMCTKEFWVSLTDNIYHVAGNDIVSSYGDRNVEYNKEVYERLTQYSENLKCRVVRKETYAEYRENKHLKLRSDWHYGDPPSHNCVGDSMNSIPEYRIGNLG